MALVAAFLYLTGWHTPVIGYLQRAILATGIIQPDMERIDESRSSTLSQLDLNIKLVDAEGEILNLQQFRDKVLFINLWATWCPPCLAEMPNIDQLYRDLEPEEVVFLMISADKEFSKAVAYVEAKDFQFPIYQIAGNWPLALNSTTLPTTFVIDKQGRLVLEHRGMAKYDTKDFKAFLRGMY